MKIFNFRINRYIAVLFISTLFMTSLPSCKKDKEGCTDPLSENYDNDADIDNGTCTYARDKFIGTYSGTENCTSGTYSWTMTITRSSTDPAGIILDNIGDFGENFRATVNGANLTLNDTQSGLTMSGTGTINGGALTINYQASGAFVDECVANCVKQ